MKLSEGLVLKEIPHGDKNSAWVKIKKYSGICPNCKSSNIHWSPSRDRIDLTTRTFSKFGSCNNCNRQFSISGRIVGPILVDKPS